MDRDPLQLLIDELLDRLVRDGEFLDRHAENDPRSWGAGYDQAIREEMGFINRILDSHYRRTGQTV